MHNAEADVCECPMCDPPVTLTSKPFDAPGNGSFPPHKAEMVTIHVRRDATEDDVRRTLYQYPCAIESALRTFREMRAASPTEP